MKTYFTPMLVFAVVIMIGAVAAVDLPPVRYWLVVGAMSGAYVVGRVQAWKERAQLPSRGRCGLVGWDCPNPACGVFNGDAKERLQACRACETPRKERRQ